MPPDRPDLFGVAEVAPNFFVSDPSHVRSRLSDMLAAMRSSKRWPWEQVMVELYRETVWPYHSGGTMGVIQRYGMERLRNAMGYSRQKTTICVTPAESGWRAGVGKLLGVDPHEMAESDLIVVWGGNPVSTQVNAMVHIAKARKQRGAKLVVSMSIARRPSRRPTSRWC